MNFAKYTVAHNLAKFNINSKLLSIRIVAGLHYSKSE